MSRFSTTVRLDERPAEGLVEALRQGLGSPMDF